MIRDKTIYMYKYPFLLTIMTIKSANYCVQIENVIS